MFGLDQLIMLDKPTAKGHKSNFSFITYTLPLRILKLTLPHFTFSHFVALPPPTHPPGPPSVSIFYGTPVLWGNLYGCRKLAETRFDTNLEKSARWSCSVKMVSEYWAEPGKVQVLILEMTNEMNYVVFMALEICCQSFMETCSWRSVRSVAGMYIVDRISILLIDRLINNKGK